MPYSQRPADWNRPEPPTEPSESEINHAFLLVSGAALQGDLGDLGRMSRPALAAEIGAWLRKNTDGQWGSVHVHLFDDVARKVIEAYTSSTLAKTRDRSVSNNSVQSDAGQQAA